MRLRRGCELRNTRGRRSLLVFEKDHTRALAVNESFAELWEMASLLGDFSAGSLASAMLERYDMDDSEALVRAQSLIELWQKEGLTEP